MFSFQPTKLCVNGKRGYRSSNVVPHQTYPRLWKLWSSTRALESSSTVCICSLNKVRRLEDSLYTTDFKPESCMYVLHMHGKPSQPENIHERIHHPHPHTSRSPFSFSVFILIIQTFGVTANFSTSMTYLKSISNNFQADYFSCQIWIKGKHKCILQKFLS